MKKCLNCHHLDLHGDAWCCCVSAKILTRNINGKIEDKKELTMNRSNCEEYYEEFDKERVKEFKIKVK